MKRLRVINAIMIIMLVFSFSLEDIHIGAQTYNESSKGEIVIDPANKKNISGYVNICYAFPERASRTLKIKRGLINLKDAMLTWTKIDTRLDSPLRLSSPQIKKMPFIYIAFEKMLELTEPEKKNIGEYLLNGGFMVIENISPTIELNLSESAFKRVFKGVLDSRGRFAPIRNNHPLYYSFFDFTDGPPRGAETHMVEVRSLEGLSVGDRLVAIYSNKRYVVKWTESQNNDPQLRMGINMLVFALTQKGGIIPTSKKTGIIR